MSALAPVDAATIIAARQFIAERVSPDARGQYLSGKHDHFAVIQACAAAILAERERCAQVAEGVGRDASRDRDIFVMTGVAGLSRVIAAAIRTPHLPSGAAACSADTSVATLLPATEGQSEEQNSLSTPTPSHPDSDTAGAGASAPAVPIKSDAVTFSPAVGAPITPMSHRDIEWIVDHADAIRADGGADITMKHEDIRA